MQENRWESIESAPEDKTDILAIAKDHTQHVIHFEGKWHSKPGISFTHWMRLPKAPKE